MSKEDQNLTSDEIPEKTIEYAWKWFEYHAGQRLIAFRFFLILLGAVLVSVRDSIEKEQFFFIGVIGGISFVISLAFLAIEVRNKQLVDLGREALKKIENSSFKQDYNLLKLAHNSLEERHWLLSYSFWLIGFDLDRILQHLYVQKHDDSHFVLDRKAIEALESALLANDQLYRAVYYHQKVRAATKMLQALLMRVADLVTEHSLSTAKLFKRENHPLLKLIQNGRNIDLETYLSLTENHIWSLIEEWQEDSDDDIDDIVRDYATRLWHRKLHTAVDISGYDDAKREEKKALHKLINKGDQGKDEKILSRYYILPDTSRRKSYKEGDKLLCIYFDRSKGLLQGVWAAKIPI